MIKEDEITSVGKLLKTHALKGEMNLVLDIDPGYLEEGNPAILDIDGIYVPFYAESVRTKGSFSYLVKFEGIESEIEAKKLVNKTVYALRERLKEFMLENFDEEYALYDDLIGWTIEDKDAGVIGKVVEIDTNTENELFIVETPVGNTVYIPLTEDFIEKMDEDSKTIHMNLPEGLLDLN
ncbi:MAG: ribosome maturation factor RimM [Muribaculaceae bacterium]|nr:ribosome maturation factor RimM [Muribaculaceae bacterium]MDE6631547.1 ribosome maturation factor RimM [Muribaculaceae bacterium]